MTEGRVIFEPKHANQNRASQSESYRDLYTDHTRQLIAKQFEEDIARFQFTF